MVPIRGCDYCGYWKATKKKHPAGYRLCGECERKVTVDESGKFTPRTLSEFIVMAAEDCIR